MGAKLDEFMREWRLPRLLTAAEVVSAVLELLADDSQGGGAVMAVMPSKGRLYWRFHGDGPRRMKTNAASATPTPVSCAPEDVRPRAWRLPIAAVRRWSVTRACPATQALSAAVGT
jgi:hypothetical protein